MYRPKFCAECGDKIIRLRWRWWTSSRFCAGCAPRFRNRQLSQLAAAGVALLMLGIVIGQAARSAPPLVIQRSQETAKPVANTDATAITNSSTGSAGAGEEIYLCGARTKKGTPCSRRVHGAVRCWQHKGMPAMLSQDKLRIKE